MKILILVFLVIVVIVALVLAKIKNSGNNTKSALPYFRKEFLNKGERELFEKLIEAMPTSYVITQIRLADIVSVKKSNENWQGWQNKISQKSVDFVICNKSFVVLACIELDGKTHEREDRKKTDTTKDEILNAAGIPIIRIKTSDHPSVEEIKKRLEEAVMHHKP